ncbi:MAG: nicotinate phosphoribosyltransferase [Candidatus Bathyarchaeia archaeon]|nr:nicotinate phosphoribosyltransferase [Candidatus Bathyarchaeota archaeon]
MKGTLGFVDEHNMSMLTDLYELTMCASYFEHRKFEPATFDLFIRRLPPNRSYFLFAGLEQVLLFLEKMRFTEQHIEYLKSLGFKDDFLDYLRRFRFSGDVWAIPEGTVVFPNEPLIRVTAPIIEAQLIETFLLNTINLQTTIATKASRVVYAAQGRPVIEFGLRREHGTDAGMKVARASYIAGCSGTSNVLAGMVYGIPVFGTMAHSFVMFFSNELESFRAFAKTFPDKSTLLIDTFDNIGGALNAIKVAKELENQGFKLRGVRIDSGDLVAISREVRRLLDENGLSYVQIFASGDLDEYRIEELLNKGAKIDAFGVGTKMGTSADRPYVDIIYKLCEKADEKGMFAPIMKLSERKATLPGRKQVFRFADDKGYFVKDVIALEGEEVGGEPLLVKVMEGGRIVYDLPSLEEIRKRALDNLARLPDKYKRLRGAAKYPVRLSPKLRRLIKELSIKLRETEDAVASSS